MFVKYYIIIRAGISKAQAGIWTCHAGPDMFCRRSELCARSEGRPVFSNRIIEICPDFMNE
jgi:hypothetical protein